MEVCLKQLAHGRGLPLPAAQSELAAGLDLPAAIGVSPWILAPGSITVVPTGLALALPAGYEGQVRPRSGLAMKYGVTLINSPGTIDADYRGEIKVGLINLGQEPFVLTRGARIAQLIIAPVVRAQVRVVAELASTLRGQGGFGHTGI
jgi:dUTP pyrophosphatase